MKPWYKKLILIIAILIINGLFFYSVNASTKNGGVNIELTVPSSGGGGGGCGLNCPVPDNILPIISNVATSTTYTSASINWSATDDKGISAVTFQYGLTLAYTESAVPSGSYSINLTGLTTSTFYYYKITVTDTSSNVATYIGSFKTAQIDLAPDVIAPIITDVASSTTHDTALISWVATDNVGFSSVMLQYGTTMSYGLSFPPTGNYMASLSNLATNTLYYFKIIAVDFNHNTSSFVGTFKTSIYNPPVVGPKISNLLVSTGVNSAVVAFKTDINATAQINYGESVSLGSSANGGQNLSTDHSISLLGLSPNKTHYYQIIATDFSLNSTSTSILNFKTLPDLLPPPNVSNLEISTDKNTFLLSWKNPSLSFTSDFAGVKILRKISSQATGPNDTGATVIYEGGNETVADASVVAGFTYYYTVYSYDNSKNYSSGNFVQGKINLVVNTEICNDGIDNNFDGKTDCNDQTCFDNTACLIKTPTSAEICNNKIDDNKDGKVDCVDDACINNTECKKTEIIVAPTGGSASACADEKDNDGDEFIDFPADKGCLSEQDNDEYNSPAATVPDFEKLALKDLKFFSGGRQIELGLKEKTIIGLAGSNLSIGIRKSALISEPKSLILRVGDSDQHHFSFDNLNNTYYVDALFPQSGNNQAFIEINYGEDQADSLGLNLQAIDFGRITDSNNNSLSGAEITLYKEDGTVFSAQIFGQKNPQITNGLAAVGWMVPNGRFYITAKKDRFYDYKGSFINVNNNIINQSISLTAIPPKIQDVIDPNASVVKNVVNVAQNIAQKTTVATAVAVKNVEKAVVAVQEIASDPEVKKVATTVVAPTAVGVAAVSSVAFASWIDLVPLLRFLFLQPLLVLGRGKREKWGMVYNSLSKMPVDLALVRLFNLETGKLIQTKVTSSDGRYFFAVDAGRYRIEIRKGAYVFPTVLLKGFQADGQRVDIYHGEEIKVTEKGSVITANIPLDPAGQKMSTPLRLIFNKIVRRLQHVISWIGLVVTLVTLYISPVWYMWLLLAIHLLLMFVFRRLSKPPVAKGWGIVYDEQTHKPLSKVVARLFDSKFNKLVATEITGPDGKYYFMAGDNQYYISYDHDGYQPIKTDIIDLKGKESETIAQDIKLKKK